MSGKSVHVLGDYLGAWRKVLSHWKILLLIFVVNLLIAILSLMPLRSAVSAVFGDTVIADSFSDKFSYTYLMDFANNYSDRLSGFLPLFIGLAVPYILWSVFVQGGWIGMFEKNRVSNPFQAFFAGGYSYFFRFLRISFYVLLLIALLFFVIVLMPFKDFYIFDLEAENPMILKFKLLVGLFVVGIFLTSIFNHIAKIYAVSHSESALTNTNLMAAKTVASWKYIFLGLLNWVGILLISLVYFLFKKISGSPLWYVIIIGQLYLVFRIAAKATFLGSFYSSTKENIIVSSDSGV